MQDKADIRAMLTESGVLRGDSKMLEAIVLIGGFLYEAALGYWIMGKVGEFLDNYYSLYEDEVNN